MGSIDTVAADALVLQFQPSSSDSTKRQWRGRDVVFVDPLDASAPYWWPAMVVPTDEIDATMGCTQLGDSEYLVKYFEDNKYSTVRGSELRLFDTNQPPFTDFAGSAPGFLKDRAIKSALSYLRSGHIHAKFHWAMWHTGSDTLALPFVLREAQAATADTSLNSVSSPLPASPSRSSRSNSSKDDAASSAADVAAPESPTTHANSSAAESDSSTLVATKKPMPSEDQIAASTSAAPLLPEHRGTTDGNNNDIDGDDDDDNASEHSGDGNDDDAERPVRSRRGRSKNALASRRNASSRPRTRRSRSASTSAAAIAGGTRAASKSKSPQLSDSTKQEDDENGEESSDHDAKSQRRSTTANAEGEDSAAAAAAAEVPADTPDFVGTPMPEDTSTPPAEDPVRQMTRRQANTQSPGRPSRRLRQQQQQQKTAAPSPSPAPNGTGKRGRPPLNSRSQNQNGTIASMPAKQRRHNGGAQVNRRSGASGSLSMTIPDFLLGEIPRSTTAIAEAAAAVAAAIAETADTPETDRLQSTESSSRMTEIAKEIEDVQEEYRFFRSLVRKSAKDLWIEMGNEWPPTLVATNTRFGKRRKLA